MDEGILSKLSKEVSNQAIKSFKDIDWLRVLSAGTTDNGEKIITLMCKGKTIRSVSIFIHNQINLNKSVNIEIIKKNIIKEIENGYSSREVV